MNIEQPSPAGSHPMEFFLTQDFELNIPQEGDLCEGIVIAHTAKDILVDIGAKSEGIITSRELEGLGPDIWERLAVGKEISVYVVSTDGKNGQILLSYGQAAAAEDWETARSLMETQDIYECQITGYNKGGLLTKVGQVRAFIPNSQLASSPHTEDTPLEVYLRQFVGKRMKTKVIEVDSERNRLILSVRAAARVMREAKRNELLDALNEGDVCSGKIVNLERFGAFVDIGGLQGLVHLSEISWKRISDPRDVLEVGQEVDVYVLNVDHDKQRVALSLKRLLPDPWSVINDYYTKGQLVEVTITKLEPYGAFARLNDQFGLEGLIHVSELAETRVKRPSDIVQEDQIVAARIIRIDANKRQLGLSLKQVVSNSYMELDLANAENNATFTADGDDEG